MAARRSVRQLLLELPEYLLTSSDLTGDVAFEMRIEALRKQRICLLVREWIQVRPAWRKPIPLSVGASGMIKIKETANRRSFTISERSQAQALVNELSLATCGQTLLASFVAELFTRIERNGWDLLNIDRSIVRTLELIGSDIDGRHLLAQADAFRVKNALESQTSQATGVGRGDGRL